MPADFVEGFFASNTPAWHGLGVVLKDFPERPKAMELAGHDFTVMEHALYTAEFGRVPGYKALTREYPDRPDHPLNGTVLSAVNESHGYVQPEMAWDVVDAFVGEGAKYETGITLKGGAVCSVLAWLPEPAYVPGDPSAVLPFVNVGWSYDGSAKFAARYISIRVVCSNTFNLGEAQGKRHDTEFEFKHTKNVAERVKQAKDAIPGIRLAHEEYLKLGAELGTIKITPRQREIFITELLPKEGHEAAISDRVAANIDEARAAVRALFDGPTIPEDHRFTAYGLHLAGGEYLDHIRGYRNMDTRFNRSILRREPAKAKLNQLIREVATA